MLDLYNSKRITANYCKFNNYIYIYAIPFMRHKLFYVALFVTQISVIYSDKRNTLNFTNEEIIN